VPPGQWIRNNLIGEIVALSVRAIPLAYMVMHPALVRVATSFDDAARVAGGSWWLTSRRIVLPLLRPAILGSMMVVFIAVVNDYEAAVFLTKPGTQLMSVEMLRLSGRGTGGPVAALAVVQLVITVVVLICGGVALKLMTRGGRRV
jgi:iron(III) transport system permease protein